MFKTETHLHTSEVSGCGKVSADEMVKLYREAGYSTVFVTDHFSPKYFKKLGEELTWQEKVDCYFEGYEKAKAAGEKYGVNVIRSCELSLSDGPNDYLLLGVDEAFLKERPDIFDLSIKEVHEYARSRGVTVVQAHPKRGGRCYPVFDFVDAVEVYNSNPRHDNMTDEVLLQAKKYSLPITAGSDAHRYEDIACSGVVTDYEIKTTEDYLRALYSGELKIIWEGGLIEP